MTRLTVEGYVIVSADGMLAEARSTNMPEALLFATDQAFVAEQLSRVGLVVRGRHSTDEFAGRENRLQVIVTRRVASIVRDAEANATLWNPKGASFDEACKAAGSARSRVAVLGGPEVYALFLDRFEVFYLSQASQTRIADGKGCFPGVPERTPQQILMSRGMWADEPRTLDAANDVIVTPWRRS